MPGLLRCGDVAVAGADARPARSGEQGLRVFRLLVAGEQLLQAFDRSQFAMQHLLHRAGNRQFDVVAFGLAHDFVGGLDRFNHLADLAHRLVDGLPAPEREAQPSGAIR